MTTDPRPERPLSLLVAALRGWSAAGSAPAAAQSGPATAATEPEIGPGDWAQYNCDVRGWRYNAAERELSPANARRIREQWRFPARGSGRAIGVVHATPVVANGDVYVGTATDPHFYRISSAGELVWSYEIDSALPEDAKVRSFLGRSSLGAEFVDGVFNAALVTRDRVYFGTFGGQVICLDRATGKRIWRVKTKEPPFPGAHLANIVMSAPILADGKLIVAGGGFEHGLGALPDYPCCSGRGFVTAFDPASGRVIWKYDVGPVPQELDPPLQLQHDWGTTVFRYGPSTSSVWSTPTYDEGGGLLFFGTDTNNAPRRPTPEDGRLHTPYSCAIIAIRASDGREEWVCQLAPGDVRNYSMRAWDSRTGYYKDLSIGDSPKVYEIERGGVTVPVVGVGCKNGSFYVIDRRSGRILGKTPTFQGPPLPGTRAVAASRILALPSPIGGLQTGCAFDGERVYANGIDFPTFGTQEDPQRGRYYAPTGGRVTAVRPDLLAELWRHERPTFEIPRMDDASETIESGDPVGSGVAVANGVVAFTTTVSGRLVLLDAGSGARLAEIEIGPVWCGPSISRGNVYVGGGNVLFPATVVPRLTRFQFPKSDRGAVYCFGVPEEK